MRSREGAVYRLTPAQCQTVKERCDGPQGSRRQPEALVNGGRNYNGPKVGIAALEKSGYMLEILCIPRYSVIE